ncbi:ankyrin-3-like [Trichogramma pretiosum]|uniref:ankyrin-3-like n=1 Tax=Trichogramma pretiosum TaxID=7493 RepID=UPI000C71B563|nr:ankyrin-3-like [Trichogramma pretiosum]
MVNNKQDSLQRLKTLREQVNWSVEEDRRTFLQQLYHLTKKWSGKRPKLREIFQREEIDWLLIENIKNLEVLDMSDVDRIIEFFINNGYKDKSDVGKDGKPLLRRTTAIHWAARGEYSFLMKYRIRDLLKIYKVDVNYTDDFGLTHFHVACQYDCYDEVVEFLKFGQDPNCLSQESDASSVDPPLHLALKHERKKIVELLLRSGASPNLTNKDGFAPLHALCSRKDSNFESMQLFFQICDDVKQPVQIDARDKLGNTPLHAALEKKHLKVVELLLKRGANANLANEEGSTPLHNICKRYGDDIKTLEIFLDINAELDQLVQLDVQDKKGNTPLHLALGKYNKKVAVLLLKYGANANLTNEDGQTPLHIACSYCWSDLAWTFLKTIDYVQQTIEVNAQDKKGWTPLHVALDDGYIVIAELLMKRGADQNMADVDGLTPLHIICKRYDDDHVAKTFFRMNQKLGQTVQVDARDKLGRTPLQLAVANSLLNVVDVILDGGADLSNFVFPTEDDFNEFVSAKILFELDRAFRTLAVVERLEKRGYELDRIGALTIMKLFAKCGVNNQPINLDKYLNNNKADESFVKNLKINPTLSLYDLIRLPYEEASKVFIITDWMSFIDLNKGIITWEFLDACTKYLRDIIYRRFCRRWALEFFLSLTCYQLPILCCDIIIRQLMNEDLLRMCLAAENL